MSQISDDNIRSYLAFRPSVYATGVQTVQPYTEAWPEGSDYGGSLANWWFELVTQPNVEQQGAVGGTCVDHQGLFGTPGQKVSCALLADRLAGRAPGTTAEYDPEAGIIPRLRAEPEPEEEEKGDWKNYALVGAGVLLGVTTLVLIGRKFSEVGEEE